MCGWEAVAALRRASFARRWYFFFEAGDFAQHLKDGLMRRWGPLPAAASAAAHAPGSAMGARAAQHAAAGEGDVRRWGLPGAQQAAAALSEALAACPACAADPFAASLHATLAAPAVSASGGGLAAGSAEAPTGAAAGGGCRDRHGLGPGGLGEAFVMRAHVPWPLSLVLCTGGVSPGASAGAQRAGQAPGGLAGEVWEGQQRAGGAPAPRRYGEVSCALLRMRVCAAALQRAWLGLGKATAALGQQQRREERDAALAWRRRAPGGGGGEAEEEGEAARRAERREARRALAQALSSARGWLSEARHFASALQRASSGLLLGACWARFARSVAGRGAAGSEAGGGAAPSSGGAAVGEAAGPGRALDLEQLSLCHQQYLEHAAAACFLPGVLASGSTPLGGAAATAVGGAGGQAAATLAAARGRDEYAAMQQAVSAAFARCERFASLALDYAAALTQDGATAGGEPAAASAACASGAEGAATAAAVFVRLQEARQALSRAVLRVYQLLHDSAWAAGAQAGGALLDDGAGAWGGAEAAAAGGVAPLDLEGVRLQVAQSLLAEMDCDWYHRQLLSQQWH